MRLINTHPNGDQWQIETPEGVIPLDKFCKNARIKKHLTASELQHTSAMQHPTVYHYESGKTNSVRAMLIALASMGYEIEIKAPDAEG